MSFEDQHSSADEAYHPSQDSNATGEFVIEVVPRQTRKSNKITYKECSENEFTSSQSDVDAAIGQVHKTVRGYLISQSKENEKSTEANVNLETND